MKRKGFTILAVMLSLMLIIAGCGGKSNDSSSTGSNSTNNSSNSGNASEGSGGSDSAEQVELTLNGWGPRLKRKSCCSRRLTSS